MSARSLTLGVGGRRVRFPVIALVLGAVALLAVLWLAALLYASRDSGSLDSRVDAVGATVRCPICQVAIPLDDITNPQADQMRALIRTKLQQGLSEDQVRQYLVARYGAGILLAPQQQGFDALAWFVPLLVVAACAVALLLSIRRWGMAGGSAGRQADGLAGFDAAAQTAGEGGRYYEALLDRELAQRE